MILSVDPTIGDARSREGMHSSMVERSSIRRFAGGYSVLMRGGPSDRYN